ncbi:MAG TPA: carbon-nitrogen hydrolase family protein [Peptococcaceae bacterium]|nr:carbon-nitrogen hydrolase family protein [Peptococcaceae bacterium]
MRLGVAQMFIADTLQANQRKILQMAREAARRGVELLVFPEMSLTGYNPATIGAPGFRAELDGALAKIAGYSARLGMGLVVGRAALAGEKLFNAASVFLPDGSVHTYYKIHLTALEEKYFSPGDSPLIFTYKGFTVGIMICRDQNYPELARSLKQGGAEALLILSAHYYPPAEARWKIDKNRALPIARAVENNCYVFLANAVGSHIGMVSLGNSLIADPHGVVVASADESTEGILTCDIGR